MSNAWKLARIARTLDLPDLSLQATVTAGTIFQDTHKPLTMWFRAVWHVTSRKHGASAMSLQQELGLGSYKTAWTWLHKLRRAMVRPGRDRLSGTVEIDETFWESEEEGVIGRQTEHKALIAVAVEITGKKIGRIRMKQIPNASREILHEFIEEMVEPGSVICTDDWPPYCGLTGYSHDRQVQQQQEPGEHLLPHVHQVVSLFKRWLLGTHQGVIGHAHLNYYLDDLGIYFTPPSFDFQRGTLAPNPMNCRKVFTVTYSRQTSYTHFSLVCRQHLVE